ncbi:MAG: peptidase [Pseudomonadota bacterium]
MKLDSGLVYMSDTRTNAGVDNISTVRKMRSWDVPKDRTITLMSAGNLATTQAVMAWLDERNKVPADRAPSILTAPTMFEVARIVGDTLAAEVATRSQAAGMTMDAAFSGTLILGGQIAGADPRLYLIYPEGNFIEATPDNPFFQIGEAKFGKPILIRAFNAAMDYREALRLMLVSMDSTVRANLSVAPPFDVRFVEANQFAATHETRIEGDDPYYRELADTWSAALRAAVPTLPEYPA